MSECSAASHFSWLSEFNLSSYPKGSILSELAPHSRDSWSLVAAAMNFAYYHAAIGDVVAALDHLTEAEALLPSLPPFLKKGFQFVLGNLGSYIQTGDTRDQASDDPEILAAIFTLKALTLQAFDNIVVGRGLLADSVKCMVGALELKPDNLLFMYLWAMLELFVNERAFHARPCSEELVRLLFKVEDRLPNTPGILDVQVVRALTVSVVKSTLFSFRSIYTWKPEVLKWSMGLLWSVIDDDLGGLPVWFATNIVFLCGHCHASKRPAMRSFLARYSQLYPEDSKLLLMYARFLLDGQSDIEEGRKVLTKAAALRDRHAVKAIVYLARNQLKADGKEAVKRVQKMFDDFEVNVPASNCDVITLIHRGAFQFLIAKDFRSAVTDWMKAMDVDPDHRLHTAYTQDWRNTGRMHAISPAQIMREELPAHIAKSTGAEHAMYKNALEKVEDFFRIRESRALEKPKPVTTNSTKDFQKLENLFMTRVRIVSNGQNRPTGRGTRR